MPVGVVPLPAVAVYTAKNAAGDRRHFTVQDGKPVEHATWEAGFGKMLLEPDMTRTIELCGQQVHSHRYSLCWAPFELNHPKTAQQLAQARERQEERAVDRQAEENPLFADAIRSGEWRPEKKPKAR